MTTCTVCTMGQWPAENSFFVASFGPIGRRVPAGGWAVGRSVGRAVQLGWAGLPPRLSRLGRHSVGSVGRHSSRLGSWAGAGAGAEKRRLPRESRDTSGDIRRDGRQT